LWITGLTADRWPRPADPDPFLSIAQQRAAAMPWATSAGELARAQRAMGRVLGAAGTVVISWPTQVDDTRSEASALIPSDLALLAPLTPGVACGEAIFRASRTETVADPGTPLMARAQILRGGTRVLELQAKCPFRAFGELRLQAARLESPRPGIARRLRGQLAHRALELLWRDLKSQAQLRSLLPERRHELVESSIRLASVELTHATSPRLLRLEQAWLAQAIEALLEHELQRAPFEVRALELDERQEIGGIALQFRVDRIDEIEASAGGGEFIIDYKTGRPVTPRWLGARRDMPQLPAYAVARPGPVAGLAFAQLNLNEPGFRGLAARAEVRPAIREPRAARGLVEAADGFETLLANWRAWTTRLVEGHAAGEARVDPISPETCRECALAALCRIGPDMPQDDEEADGE
ncbi:MAG: PD-(D/E)XK nuclease family protein, partial [Steroidobacteraceae bacterium]